MDRLPRLAIATLPGLDHFIPDLARGLADSGAVEVRVFIVRDRAELQVALDWACAPETDAIWFEFCWPPYPALIAATDFGGRRVVVRVHRIEAYETDHVARADWSHVTDLVVVSQDMARCVRELRPDIGNSLRLHVVHNGVDRRCMVPRDGFDRFRVGWCGAFIARKNPGLALQVLHLLHRSDPRYRLHVASQSGDRLTAESFLHQATRLGLAQAVQFDGHVAAAAMPQWHAANGALLSTSTHESFGYAIAEAAAAGCDLAVLDHVGAGEFWPDDVLFVAVDEAAAMIAKAAPGRWRGLVASRFGLDRQVQAVLELLRTPDRGSCRPVEFASADYWERRYRGGGDSGAGSAGRLAAFKAAVVNDLVAREGLRTVLEFGCGDGRQLALAEYPSYVGVDVAPSALALCVARFTGDPHKHFVLAGEGDPGRAELVISLDVVFHLVEDAVFHAYMTSLFAHADRLVVIYASDRDATTADVHVRHRSVSAWVAAHERGWRRVSHIANPFPFDPNDPAGSSFADFHVFARVAAEV